MTQLLLRTQRSLPLRTLRRRSAWTAKSPVGGYPLVGSRAHPTLVTSVDLARDKLPVQTPCRAIHVSVRFAHSRGGEDDGSEGKRGAIR